MRVFVVRRARERRVRALEAWQTAFDHDTKPHAADSRRSITVPECLRHRARHVDMPTVGKKVERGCQSAANLAPYVVRGEF